MTGQLKTVFRGKAKIVSISLCLALMLSLGTLTASAAGNGTFGEKAGALAIRNEDGAVSYSTDAGATWTLGLPEGTIYSEDGSMVSYSVDVIDYTDDPGETSVIFGDVMPDLSFTAAARTALPGGDFDFLNMLSFEDGVIFHSLDDGETWIEGLPEGMISDDAAEYNVSFDSDDGSCSFSLTIDIDE